MHQKSPLKRGLKRYSSGQGDLNGCISIRYGSADRGGTVTGEHEVGFYGPSETVLLSHSAQDRVIFAHGAMRAAKFVAAQVPGEYNMDDMIKL